ncbi:hypothetical protein RSSM_04544, partial [Rhodopirellula sallentina SM41]
MASSFVSLQPVRRRPVIGTVIRLKVSNAVSTQANHLVGDHAHYLGRHLLRVVR